MVYIAPSQLSGKNSQLLGVGNAEDAEKGLLFDTDFADGHGFWTRNWQLAFDYRLLTTDNRFFAADYAD
jgi:hypothetical protein